MLGTQNDRARALPGPAHHLRRLMQCDAGEININVEGYVEVVGENIQRDMSDDFGDLSICEAMIAKRLYATGRYLPAPFQQFTRKA